MHADRRERDWARYLEEDPVAGAAEDLDGIRVAFAAVRDALSALPDGQRIHPTWTADFAELAAVYWQESTQFECEQLWTPPKE
jgi:predicted TIM-barrel fold metal-dependent hydrolase